jgi:hypothetical protein
LAIAAVVHILLFARLIVARTRPVRVLDAIIHPDGSIGDITVLRSTNDLFARAAIETVNFTLT